MFADDTREAHTGVRPSPRFLQTSFRSSTRLKVCQSEFMEESCACTFDLDEGLH